jgi:CCR4-NOT complex subunit CAF16
VSDPAIVVRGLRFRYRSAPSWVLDGVDLTVERGSRCLVIGANGAGKTTLLRVLGGKHMVDRETVQVLGASAFHDTELAGRVEFLGANFPFAVDLTVGELIDHAVNVDARRIALLVEVLDIDRSWHMHAVSDGQRRRVQLLLGLMRPHDVLFLDEATTDLDLLARAELLAFLRRESEGRGTTVLYATHIFDALDEWATHLVYLVAGRVKVAAPLAELPELTAMAGRTSSPLYHLVEDWLRRDDPRRGGPTPTPVVAP